LHSDLGQAVNTSVPPLLSSIIWYRPRGWSLWMGKYPRAWWKVTAVTRFMTMSTVGWLPRNRDQLQAQRS